MEFFAFDKQYADRLGNGDAATEQHFLAYFEQLLRMKIRARTLNSDRVEDIRQETFIRVIAALRREGGLRQPERFGAFVNSICNNVVLEYYRLNGRGQSLEEPKNLVRPPGSALCAIADFLCSKRTVEEIVTPLVADMQFEYNKECAAGRKYKAQWVRAQGCWSFLTTLGFKFLVEAFGRMTRAIRAKMN